MKKDRNCGGNATPYPVYPMYGGGGMPGPIPMTGVNMPMPLPMPAPTWTTQGTTTNQSFTNSEINTLSNQINSLEQRVSNLENMVNKAYSNNYNTSNFQMM